MNAINNPLSPISRSATIERRHGRKPVYVYCIAPLQTSERFHLRNPTFRSTATYVGERHPLATMVAVIPYDETHNEYILVSERF